VLTRPGREQLGPYELLFRLGSGGMAEVYAACVRREGGFEKLVAIKRVLPALAQDPELCAMMLDEARVAANIDSPNVVSALDVGRTPDGQLYLVMDLVVGVPLARLMSATAQLGQLFPIPVVLEILTQAASGLHAAHEAVTPAGNRLDIVHRDISPQNLLVGVDGRVRISDFGIARAAERVVTTLVPRMLGKLAYGAPEQLRKEEVDRRVDVYALAVVAFELFAGRRLFPREVVSTPERFRATEPSDVLEARPELAPAAALAIARGLIPDPKRRWPTARAFSDALLLGAGVAPCGREALSKVVRALVKEETDRLAESIRGAMGPTREGRTPSVPQATTMRSYATAFVGRDAEAASLREIVLGSDRLITILGPGGVGKTRLAVEVAQGLAASFPGGVRFADLTEARTIDGICQELGRALGIPLLDGNDYVTNAAELGRVLASRPPTLLVIDNFEQVSAHAASTLGRWLATSRDVKLLVTSRERLHLDAERLFELDPLDTTGGVGPSAAARLFADRASKVRRGFVLDAENTAAVAEIVKRLDGLPLAIELAASRVRSIDPTQLATQLATQIDGRLSALSKGSRDAAPRQATLEAAIRWSWDLLDANERAVFSRCSVFRGGFDADAAEAVGATPSDALWVGDILEQLVDKSLVRIGQSQRAPRFSMFESLREFAWRELGRSLERDAAMARYVAYFVALGERWERERKSTAQRVAVCQRELENFVGAFEWARDQLPHGVERSRALVGIALALEPLLSARGPTTLARQLFLAALGDDGQGDAVLEPALRVRARLGLARALTAAGRAPETARVLDAAATIASAIPDDPIVGWIDVTRGEACWAEGDLEGAVVLCGRAGALAERSGDRRLRARALARAGGAQVLLGDGGAAERSLSAALPLAREIGDEQLEGRALKSLADVASDAGREAEAVTLLERAVTLAKRASDAALEAGCLVSLGIFALERGEAASGCDRITRALELVRDAGNHRSEGLLLAYLALCTEGKGDLLAANQIYETSEEANRRGHNALGEGLALAFHGRLLANLGLVTEAEDALTRGEQILARIGDHVRVEVARLCRGHLELARAWSLEATGAKAEATALRAKILERIASAAELSSRSHDVRVASARLARAIHSSSDATMSEGDLVPA
jgi:predicted ATPase/serine/threonine protein kinase